MLSAKAKLREQGRIVIPKEIREVMNLKPGEEITFYFSDGELKLTSVKNASKKLRELLKPNKKPGKEYVESFINLRRQGG